MTVLDLPVASPHLVCLHEPRCPSAGCRARDAARVVSCHPDQGWSLLCNGVILFADTGEILPAGGTIEPRRCPPPGSGAVAHPPVLPVPRRRTA